MVSATRQISLECGPAGRPTLFSIALAVLLTASPSRADVAVSFDGQTRTVGGGADSEQIVPLLSLRARDGESSEAGAILRRGGGDVATTDHVDRRRSRTVSVEQLLATGAAASDGGFDLIFRVDEPAPGRSVTLKSLRLSFTDDHGGPIPGVNASASLDAPLELAPAGDGGAAGHVLRVRFSEEAWAAFVSSPTNRIEATAAITGVSGGPEEFFLARPAAASATTESAGSPTGSTASSSALAGRTGGGSGGTGGGSGGDGPEAGGGGAGGGGGDTSTGGGGGSGRTAESPPVDLVGPPDGPDDGPEGPLLETPSFPSDLIENPTAPDPLTIVPPVIVTDSDEALWFGPETPPSFFDPHEPSLPELPIAELPPLDPSFGLDPPVGDVPLPELLLPDVPTDLDRGTGGEPSFDGEEPLEATHANPEPGSLVLMACGTLGLAAGAVRRRHPGDGSGPPHI
ncbi:MAG TPA: hypothetical protein VF170_06635 [Planctomycetaceae bacterium]